MPNLPVATKMRQNTASGARRMATPTIHTMASAMASSASTTRCLRAGACTPTPAPNSSANTISGSICICAMAPIMLRGRNISSTRFILAVAVVAAAAGVAPRRLCASPENACIRSARMAGSNPSPGRTQCIAASPSSTENAVVSRKKIAVRTPMRPSARRSPSRATDAASAANTSGTTTRNSRRRNTCPIGYATQSVTHASDSRLDASPSVRAWAPTPVAAPSANAIRIAQWFTVRRAMRRRVRRPAAARR